MSDIFERSGVPRVDAPSSGAKRSIFERSGVARVTEREGDGIPRYLRRPLPEPEDERSLGTRTQDYIYEKMQQDWNPIDQPLGYVTGAVRGVVQDLPTIAAYAFSGNEVSPYSPDPIGDLERNQAIRDETAASVYQAIDKPLTAAMGPRGDTIEEQIGGFIGPVRAGGAIFRQLGKRTLSKGVRESIGTSVARRAAQQAERSPRRVLAEEAATAVGAGYGSEAAEGTPLEIPAAVVGGVAGATGLAAVRGSAVGAAELVGKNTRWAADRGARRELEHNIGDPAAVLASLDQPISTEGVRPTLAGYVGRDEVGVGDLEAALLTQNPELRVRHGERARQNAAAIQARLRSGDFAGAQEELRAGIAADREVVAAAARGEVGSARNADMQAEAQYQSALVERKRNIAGARGEFDQQQGAAQAAYKQAIAERDAAIDASRDSFEAGQRDLADQHMARAREFEDRAIGLNRQVQQEFEALPGDPVGRSFDTQNRLRDHEKKVLRPLGDRYDAMYALAAKNGVKIPTNAVRRVVDNFPHGGEQYSRLPGDVRAQIDELKSNATWASLRDLDVSLGAASRRTFNRDARFEIDQLHDAVKDILKAPEVTAVVPGLSKLNAEYANAMDVFRKGKMEDVLATNDLMRTPGSNFIQTIFRGDTTEGAVEDSVRLRAAIRDDPQLLADTNDAIVAVAARGMRDTETGEFLPKNAAKWLSDHRASLEPFPEARDRIAKLFERSREAQAAREAVPGAYKPDKAPDFGAEIPEPKQPERVQKPDFGAQVPEPKRLDRVQTPNFGAQIPEPKRPDRPRSPDFKEQFPKPQRPPRSRTGGALAAESSWRTRLAENPHSTMGHLMREGTPKDVADLMNQAGKTDVQREGVRRLAYQWFAERIGKTPDPDDVAKLVEDNASRLEPMISTDGLSNLREVIGDLRLTETAPLPNRSAVPSTSAIGEAESEALRLASTQLLSPTRRTIRGGVALSRYARSKAGDRIREALEELITNPTSDRSRALLNRVRSQNKIPLTRYNVNPYATGAGAAISQEEEQRP